jgi:formylglycine-generating enzyme required for sulfatase activity
MKEWITPVLVILGLIVVGFGIRALIIDRSKAPAADAQSNAPDDESGPDEAVKLPPGEGNPNDKGPKEGDEKEAPRTDPGEPEAWEDKNHPFFGYPEESAPAKEIQIKFAKARAEHPPDDMVAISEGDFTMGDDKIAASAPARQVFAKAFKIMRYEVANALYQKFVKDTGHRQPELLDDWALPYSWREQTYPKGTADLPVTLVSHKDAAAYCKWAGMRLPTEIEWEKASRGAKGNRYPWGMKWDGRKAHTVERFSGPLADEKAWSAFADSHETAEDSGSIFRALAVGSYPEDRSQYGVSDLHGNVSEWVDAEFVAYEGGDGKASALFGDDKVAIVRGNSFANRDYAAPAAVRFPFLKEHFDGSIGFRCAIDD